MNNLLSDDKRWNTIIRQAKAYGGEFRPTPQIIIDQMLDKAKIDWSDPNNKFLDPACGIGTFLRSCYIRLIQFHTEEHVLNNMLYGVEINGLKYIGLKQTGFKNIIRQDFMQELPKHWPDNFDFIVSNPPYSAKLDINFLHKSLDIVKDTGKILFVHPSSVYIDKMNTMEVRNTYRQKIWNKIEYLSLFNGNVAFGITVKYPCSVIVLDMKKDSPDFIFEDDIAQSIRQASSLDEVTIFGIDEDFNSFSKKIFDINSTHKSIKDEVKKKGGSTLPYVVSLSQISGHTETKDPRKFFKNNYFILVGNMNNKVIGNGNEEYDLNWYFETETEAKNFIGYLQTDFARACLATSKIYVTNTPYLKRIPYLDFKKSWTDEELYAKFGISEEEISSIKRIIVPYHNL